MFVRIVSEQQPANPQGKELQRGQAVLEIKIRRPYLQGFESAANDKHFVRL